MLPKAVVGAWTRLLHPEHEGSSGELLLLLEPRVQINVLVGWDLGIRHELGHSASALI